MDDDIKTVESFPVSRPCMMVALSGVQTVACIKALGSADIVRLETEDDACKQMSTVRPFVVILDGATVTVGEVRSVLCELATACGAEVVTLVREPNVDDLSAQLVDALCTAKLRRMSATNEI